MTKKTDLTEKDDEWEKKNFENLGIRISGDLFRIFAGKELDERNKIK